MARQGIGTGSSPNDGTGDNLRVAGGKINDNFSELYTHFGDGTDLTAIVGTGIATASGLVGTGATILDFRGSAISEVTVGSGIATINVTGGNGGGSSYTDFDVNAHLNVSSAQANEVLRWTGTDYDWVAQASGGGGGGGSNLSDFSVTTNSVGTAALSYDNTSGVFTYTPPDLSSYLTSESDTLSDVVSRGSSAGGSINFDASQAITFATASNNNFEIYGSSNQKAYISHAQNNGAGGAGDLVVIAKNGFHVYGGTSELSQYKGLEVSSGDVKLQYQGNTKLQTNATGVSITGSVNADSADIDGTLTLSATPTIRRDDTIWIEGYANQNVIWAGDPGSTGGDTVFKSFLHSTSGNAEIFRIGYGNGGNGALSTPNGTLSVGGISTFRNDVTIRGSILSSYTGSTETYTVTTGSKTAAHRYNGTGSGTGYLIDGVEAPFLTLTPGKTYRFSNNNTGSHPLKFYLEADKTTEYTTGVTFDNTYTEIVVSDTTPQVLHYQCTNHAYMGNAVYTNANKVQTPYDASVKSLKLVGVNTDFVGTAGTTGDIKMFHGAPFIHDGTAWREFYLKEGVPVTESADTDWDNVIFRNTFDSTTTDVKFSQSPSSTYQADLVGSPRKYGEKALRLRNGGYVRYDHRSEYVFDGAWTIEGWFYFDALPTGRDATASILVSKARSNSTANGWSLIAEDSLSVGYVDFRWWDSNKHSTNYSGDFLSQHVNADILQTWNHIALTRDSTDGSLHFYFNGVESSTTSTGTGLVDNDIVDDSLNLLCLGNNGISSQNIDAIIDDFRISTVARYTSNFTPPTEALPVTGTLSGPVNPPYFGSVLESVISDTEISGLSNVSSSSPSPGQVLKWNGSLWAPASDNTSAGGTGIGLTDLSITTNAVGTNALSYDDSTGTFTFTPTSLVGYATEGYVDNAVLGIVTTGQISGFITAGASGAQLTGLTGAAAGTYGDFDKSARITVDSNGRITGISEIGITTDGAGINVSGISTFNDNVSFGSTILVDGAVNLAVNNATIVGTAGSTGDIKMIGGAPFFYDGTAWREFALATGTPVTESADTEWDNVIFRSDFNTDYTDQRFNEPYSAEYNASLVTSPVKYGTKALRLQDGFLNYTHRSEYVFTGAWTIEGWFYFDALPTGTDSTADVLISKSGSSGGGSWAIIAEDSSTAGYVDFRWWNVDNHGTSYSGDFLHQQTETSMLQTWNHIAIVREPLDGSIHFYFNGVESASTSSNQVIDNNIQDSATAKLCLGDNIYVNGQSFDGIIDDLRISTVARYTSDFTPPSSALPITGTTSTVYTPPNSKQGEISLGNSPTWTGTTGVTASQVASGQYRLAFSSAYSSATAYTVNVNAMDYDPATSIVGVGVSRVSASVCDFYVRRLSDSSAVDTGSLAVNVYKK